MTEEQRVSLVDHATRLIVEEKLSANKAAERAAVGYRVTGRTIQRWASAQGRRLGRVSHDSLKKAIENNRLGYEERRVRLRTTMLDAAEELLARINRPHVEYRGNGAKVHFDNAPAGAVRSYVIGVGVLVDKIRLEEGKATERSEVVAMDAIDAALDHWEDLLKTND